MAAVTASNLPKPDISLTFFTGSEGLAPGANSGTQRVNSTLGYTSSDTRAQMLANKQFVDARAQVFAKYGSTQWTLIGEFPVERRLVSK